MVLEVVILLHGIAKQHHSMKTLQKSLQQDHYQVINIGYPSQKNDIATIATYVQQRIAPYSNHPDYRIHFVTHSMGGLVTRQLLNQHPMNNVGRVVMLGPPNQGSQIADWLQDHRWYLWYYGPAGQQLTTHKARQQPFPLIDYEVGIIAGKRALDPFCYFILPGQNDGKVTVENTKLEGMTDHLVLPTTHVFIMRNKQVIEQVKFFLKNGKFKNSG